MTIYTGEIHQSYQVINVVLPKDVERRLQALGLFEGTKLTILNKKKHGAMVIKMRGTRFAIGKEIAQGIYVEACSS